MDSGWRLALCPVVGGCVSETISTQDRGLPLYTAMRPTTNFYAMVPIHLHVLLFQTERKVMNAEKAILV